MKYFCIALLAYSLLQQIGYSQEKYSFDLSEIEKKAFQFNGYLEARPVFSMLDQDSSLTLLQFYTNNINKTVSEFNFKAMLDTSFEKGITKVQARLNTDLRYSDPDWSLQASLYEGYLSIKPSLQFKIEIGKKRLKWGKGYAWNPVAFIDNPKNPNDPDLALEGFTVLSIDFIKSFPGKLRTLSFTSILLPVFTHINSELGRHNTLNFGGKLYLLLFDTDIDFLFLTGPGVSSRYGIDFSRNFSSNFEFHGEWAYTSNFSKKILNAEGLPSEANIDYTSYLLGFRILTKTETTFILEYYWNGKGYTREEMDDYYCFINQAYSLFQETGNEDDLQLASSFTEYRTFSPTQNYLYLRINQKEPFNIIYFTPSLTGICNLKDGSFSLVPELLYIPVTNFELRARGMVLIGKNETEFGEKQNNFRVELRLRYFF
ncbi:MAG: hypothetical protein KAT17_01740 [Candidatus Aminicenantes bacterium]|nr:hypothetical protein [Candidatus Aminicenantes bacterium]